MKAFLSRFGSVVTSVLSGLDRLVFRGTLIPLIRPLGIHAFLNRAGVHLIDFTKYAQRITDELKASSLREAHENDRPVRYLGSSKIDKEDLARRIAADNPVEVGLVCAFTVVEPCTSFEYHRSRNPEERGLKPRRRKCLHIYKYYRHPEFGWLNARIQTWFPFNIQICMNGREWLAQRFARAGRTDFEKNDNCFTWLANPALAQRWMDQQLELDWAKALDSIARSLNPIHRRIFRPWPQNYYWTVYQSEWATDLLFNSPGDLASIYPALVRHALLNFQSPDVMRFLGRKCHGRFQGEIRTRFKHRHEGLRVKHWADGNSIKMYDKAPTLLRVETTLAETKGLKAFRQLSTRAFSGTASDERGPLEWRQLRKGVADIHRRMQISQKANERYLDALSTIDDSTPLAKLFDQFARPTTFHGRRVRALRIGDPQEIRLLQAVSRGEFTTAGFRNADIRRILHPGSDRLPADQRRKLAAKISRQLRILRAHGVIRKVPKSHRYHLAKAGTTITAALFAARNATLKQLLNPAA